MIHSERRFVVFIVVLCLLGAAIIGLVMGALGNAKHAGIPFPR
jgi:hypothetical protein